MINATAIVLANAAILGPLDTGIMLANASAPACTASTTGQFYGTAGSRLSTFDAAFGAGAGDFDPYGR